MGHNAGTDVTLPTLLDSRYIMNIMIICTLQESSRIVSTLSLQDRWMATPLRKSWLCRSPWNQKRVNSSRWESEAEFPNSNEGYALFCSIAKHSLSHLFWFACLKNVMQPRSNNQLGEIEAPLSPRSLRSGRRIKSLSARGDPFGGTSPSATVKLEPFGAAKAFENVLQERGIDPVEANKNIQPKPSVSWRGRTRK